MSSAGVEQLPGDVHEALPNGPFDVVLMAGVTHSFRGDALARLFPRLRAIIPQGGVLAVAMFLRGQLPVAPLFAVQMLLNGRAGTPTRRTSTARG